MQPPRLHTERLVLREFRPEDVAPHVASARDPEVQRFLGGVREPYDAFSSLATHAGHWALRGYGGWVVTRAGEDRYLGRVGLWSPEGWPGIEVGWRLTRAAWGHGYATEAARAAIGWGWTVLDLPELISLIVPGNAGSQRVARRLGHVNAGPITLGAFGETERWVLARPPGDEPFALRPASVSDADRIAGAVLDAMARYRDFSPPGWEPHDYGPDEERGVLAAPDYRCVVAEPGGVLAGHVGWRPAIHSHLGSDDPGLVHLRQLFVNPGWWGTGLAARLLAVAVDDARANGFARMRLFTPGSQGRARRFYERQGWHAAAPPADDDLFGMPTVEYRREL
jgi:RimJ/RimL family protein N-acetyltransferase/GNAT superfamily N-acetyltransferase